MKRLLLFIHSVRGQSSNGCPIYCQTCNLNQGSSGCFACLEGRRTIFHSYTDFVFDLEVLKKGKECVPFYNDICAVMKLTISQNLIYESCFLDGECADLKTVSFGFPKYLIYECISSVGEKIYSNMTVERDSENSEGSSSSSSSYNKTALIASLASIGGIVVIGIIIFCIWYKRKGKVSRSIERGELNMMNTMSVKSIEEEREAKESKERMTPRREEGNENLPEESMDLNAHGGTEEEEVDEDFTLNLDNTQRTYNTSMFVSPPQPLNTQPTPKHSQRGDIPGTRDSSHIMHNMHNIHNIHNMHSNQHFTHSENNIDNNNMDHYDGLDINHSNINNRENFNNTQNLSISHYVDEVEAGIPMPQILFIPNKANNDPFGEPTSPQISNLSGNPSPASTAGEAVILDSQMEDVVMVSEVSSIIEWEGAANKALELGGGHITDSKSIPEHRNIGLFMGEEEAHKGEEEVIETEEENVLSSEEEGDNGLVLESIDSYSQS